MDPLWCQERDCPFILRCTRGRPSCPQPTTTAILHPIVGFIYDGRLLYGRCATRACMPAALANHSFGRARGPDYTVIFFFHKTYPSPDSTLPGTRSRLRTTTAPVADNTDIPCPRTAGGVACWRTARLASCHCDAGLIAAALRTSFGQDRRGQPVRPQAAWLSNY